MLQIAGSIVIYKNNKEVLRNAINSFLNTKLNVHLYLIDNSPTNELQVLAENDKRITYIFNNKNVGFGTGHNIAIKKVIDVAKYHLVLNPDVYFDSGTLETLFDYMEKNKDVGHVMPQVKFPDGTIQHLCKLLPRPYDLLLRRFLKWNEDKIASNNEKFELRFTGYNKLMEVPYLSGCFMFLRIESLKIVGLFDERIFMYIEDADLTRRIHRKYKTIFNPSATIYHHYAKGSYKNKKLLFYNIHGATIYFNKYGWFWDKEREEINERILKLAQTNELK